MCVIKGAFVGENNFELLLILRITLNNSLCWYAKLTVLHVMLHC